jgi:hypothetical protein
LAGSWVWDQLTVMLLKELRGADALDFSRAAVDSGMVRAVGGGEKTGPNPTDRRKPGSKHHGITEANGIPLNLILTPANRNDVTQSIPLVDGVPEIAGKHRRKYYWRVHSGSQRRQTVGHTISHALATVASALVKAIE